MSTQINTVNQQIEFTKKFKYQLRLNKFAISSSFAAGLIAIFSLGSCGPQIHASRMSMDKGEYTAQQCLKISNPKRTLAKRPLMGHQSMNLFQRTKKF
jgi:hypothetical protein